MSIDFEHLAPESRDEAHLPSDERIRRIQAERWIGYARAETILYRLDELLHYPQRDRMPCLLLHAATGMGKTKLLRKFRRTHPPVFDSNVGIQRMQVVAMQMPPEPDEKSFYTQLLSSVNAPVRSSMNVHQMRHVVRDLLSFVGARMLIIDEAHALLASTYRQQRILLNTLRYMEKRQRAEARSRPTRPLHRDRDGNREPRCRASHAMRRRQDRNHRLRQARRHHNHRMHGRRMYEAREQEREAKRLKRSRSP